MRLTALLCAAGMMSSPADSVEIMTHLRSQQNLGSQLVSPMTKKDTVRGLQVPVAIQTTAIETTPPPVSHVATPVQTFYVPLPEHLLMNTFDAINDHAEQPIASLISIAISADHTIIWYDHHEDGGYEYDVLYPKQMKTQVWGDNDPSNGCPPMINGVHIPMHECKAEDDVLYKGDYIILENLIFWPNNDPLWPMFDGKDKILSSFPIAITRGAYPKKPGSLLAGAVEVLDKSKWGTKFVSPVGTDTYSETQAFEYSTFYIMACEDDTVVTLPHGKVKTLNEGDCAVAEMKEGDMVISNQIIQVHLITGDKWSNYELRWYSLLPFDDWTTRYYTPVGTSKKSTHAWLYNPGDTELKVYYETLESGGVKEFTVQAGSTAKTPVAIPFGSGACFYTDGEPFFGISQSDSSYHGQLADWGHPLIPSDQLTSQVLIGWGYGCTNNNCYLSSHISTTSRSVVWVTPVTDGTIISIDYGDGRDIETVEANRLESKQLIDVADNDMTGATIYATDTNGNPVDIAVAWGQDPSRSAGGDAGALDLGTIVPPLPVIKAAKSAVLKVDADGDQAISTGDTLHYMIRIVNIGQADFQAGALVVVDDASPLLDDTTYVLNSTTYVSLNKYGVEQQSSLIPDDESETPFPLDGNGLTNPFTLPKHGVHVVSFDVVIKSYAEISGTTHIVNSGRVTTSNDRQKSLSSFASKNALNFAPSVDIELFVDDIDADSAVSKPFFKAQTTVIIKAVVTNDGEKDLEDIIIGILGVDFSLCDKPNELTPGGSFECTAEMLVEKAFDTTATVTASEVDEQAPVPLQVTDSDKVYYGVTQPNVDVELTVVRTDDPSAQPDDADMQSMSPKYPSETPVRLEYIVQNNGDSGLTNIVVTLETKEGELIKPFECPEETEQPGYVLDKGESFKCEVELTVTEDLAAVIRVEATENGGVIQVVDSDPVFYRITTPSVDVELFVEDPTDPSNRIDADSPDLAPLLPPGGTVKIIYVVTNDDESDGETLKMIQVTFPEDTLPDGNFACDPPNAFDPEFILAPSESFECSIDLPLPAEKDPEYLFTTEAQVTAIPISDETDTVSDKDAVNYKILSPDVDIEIFVNGFDADDVDSKPRFPVNSEGSLSYVVENTGNTNLDISTVTLTSTPDDITFLCEPESPPQGLQPGGIYECVGDGVLVPEGVDPEWMFTSDATVIATPSDYTSLPPESDTDPVNYGVTSPEVGIRFFVSFPSDSNKRTDANNELTAPLFPAESLVDLIFEVTNEDDYVNLKTFEVSFLNNGNIPSDTVFACDPSDALAAGSSLVLQPKESFTCTASNVSVPVEDPDFLFFEEVSVTAIPTDDEGSLVDASDPLYYKIFSPKVDVMLMVNGDDANMPNSVKFPEGSDITLSYMIKNTGNVKLTPTQVDLSGQNSPPGLPPDEATGWFNDCTLPEFLIPGQKYTCTGPTFSMPEDLDDDEEYDVTITVIAEPTPVDPVNDPPLDPIEASDPVFYGVTSPSVGIKLSVEYPDGTTYDADKASEAPLFPALVSVNLKYMIRNTDDLVALKTLNVTFSEEDILDGVTFNCSNSDGPVDPFSSEYVLDPGESFMCTSSKFQLPDMDPDLLFTIIAEVSAVPVGDEDDLVTSTDPVNYKVLSPLVDIELFVNRAGQTKLDADGISPKPLFPANSQGSLSYTIKNTGNTELTINEVNLVGIPDGLVFACGDIPNLIPGQSFSCAAEGTIVPEGAAPDYMVSATATVKGVPSIDDTLEVSDTDPVNYGVTSPAVDIELYVVYPSGSNNLDDADLADEAPMYPAGESVDIIYRITNTDDYVSLEKFVVTFLDGGSLNGAFFSCDEEGALDASSGFTLDPFDFFVCNASGVTLPDEDDPLYLFEDEASVSAVPVDDPQNLVDDKDPLFLKIFSPSIDIELTVNDKDADDTPALFPGGSIVTLEYKVTNTGNTVLNDLTVDIPGLPNGVVFLCGGEKLVPGEMVRCRSSDITVPEDLPENEVINFEATATANPENDPSPVPTAVVDSDEVNYGVTSPSIEIKLYVEDPSDTFVDANEIATSPLFPAGYVTRLQFSVTNTDDTVTLNTLVLMFDSPLPDELSTFNCNTETQDSFELQAGSSPSADYELGPGESLTCTASGFPLPENEDPSYEYKNNVKVAGVPTNDPTDLVTSEDGVNFRVYSPEVTVMLTVNDKDANTPGAGPKFPKGSDVNLSYMITNSGNTNVVPTTPVTSGTVLPPGLPEFDCDLEELSPGQKVSCDGPTFRIPEDVDDDEEFDVTLTVIVEPVNDPTDREDPVQGTDPVYYGVTSPSIGIKAYVEDPEGTRLDANSPDEAPLILPSETVKIVYTVKNTDDTVPLRNIAVDFDELPDTITFDCGDVDPFSDDFVLDPMESFTCVSSGLLVPDKDPEFVFETDAQVQAVPTDDDDIVESSDPVFYKVFSPLVDIKLFVNRDGEPKEDADTALGKPLFPVNSEGVISYVITNTGNTNLNILDVIFSEDPLVEIACGEFPDGLEPTLTWVCEGSGVLVPGEAQPDFMFSTDATVTAVPSDKPSQPEVSDTDPVNYGVTTPAIAVEFYVDDPDDADPRDDADSANGAPLFPAGETVDLILEITNMDDFVDLESLQVTFLPDGDLPADADFACDTPGALDDGSPFVLETMASLVCTASVILPEEDPTYLFNDIVTVTAIPTNDANDVVDAMDALYYGVFSPSIDVQLVAQEIGDDDIQDGDSPDDPALFPKGTDVNITFTIKNDGNTVLENIDVDFSTLPENVTFSCQLPTSLDPGASFVCHADSPATIPADVPDEFIFGTNVTVAADPSDDPRGEDASSVTDSDPLYYGVTSPEVSIKLYVEYPGDPRGRIDANSEETAPLFPVGGSVTLTYVVTNEDDTVPLKDFQVAFLPEGDIPAGTIFSCDPENALTEGSDFVLPPLESFECELINFPLPDNLDPSFLFEDEASVTAVPTRYDEDVNVTSTDPVFYKVFSPGVEFTLLVQGNNEDIPKDANSKDTAPLYPKGSEVVLIYMIENTGNTKLNIDDVTLSNDELPDDVNFDCEFDVLDPGKKVTCVSSPTTIPANAEDDFFITTTGTVTVFPLDDATDEPVSTLSDTDPVSFGVTSPEVGIVLVVESPDGSTYDADTPADAPSFPVGQTVKLRYTVTNKDDYVALKSIQVTFPKDNLPDGTTFTCPENSVDPAFVLITGSSFVCESNDIHLPEEKDPDFLFMTMAQVSAVPVDDEDALVQAQNPVNYKLFSPLIDIELFVNRDGFAKFDSDEDDNSKPRYPESSQGALSYDVTNTGNTDLNLTDVTFTFPEEYSFSCVEFPLLLPPGETYSCEGPRELVPAGTDPDTVFGTEATVTAFATEPLSGTSEEVQDSDPVIYGVTSPEVDIEFYVDYADDDEPRFDADWPFDAAMFPAGETVQVIYEVSNPDDYVTLNQIEVSFMFPFPDGTIFTCVPPLPQSSFEVMAGNPFLSSIELGPGDMLTCTTSYPLPEEDPAYLFANQALVVASPTDDPGTQVTDFDDLYFKTFSPDVSIELFVNEQEADTADSGPLLPEGSTVIFSYEIENTGNTFLDIQNVEIPGLPESLFENCEFSDPLSPGELFECEASPTEVPENLPEDWKFNTNATVTATPSNDPRASPTDVTATDPVFYGVTSPNVDIKLYVQKPNGEFVDANLAEGSPLFPAGGVATIRYEVTNTDDVVTLNNLNVTFAVPLPGGTAEFTCDAPGLEAQIELEAGGAIDPAFELAPGEVLRCTSAGVPLPAEEDPEFNYFNIARVTGVPTNDPDDQVVSEDPVNFRIYSPKLEVMVMVNDIDANDPGSVKFPAGSDITISYEIKNPGNTDLHISSVVTSGAKLPPSVSFEACVVPDTLAPGGTFLCVAPTVQLPDLPDEEEFDLTVTVTASPLDDPASDSPDAIEASDPVFYGVTSPSVGIKLYVEYPNPDDTLDDANTEDEAPLIPEGVQVKLKYTVTNTDNLVSLKNFIVTFPDGDLPKDTFFSCNEDGALDSSSGFVLPQGESFMCTSSPLLVPDADPDLIINTIASVTAVPTNDETDSVGDSDPVFYRVFSPEVEIVLKVSGEGNEDDANEEDTRPRYPVNTQGLFKYIITNTGNTELDIDDVSFSSTLPEGISFEDCVLPSNLAIGGTVTCESSTDNLVPPNEVAGLPDWVYTTTATVTATPSDETTSQQPVSDSDPIFYGVLGGANLVSIYIQLYVNGIDADEPTGPAFPRGSTVELSYKVKNTGLAELKNIEVLFSPQLPQPASFECGGPGGVAPDQLAPNAFFECVGNNVPIPEDAPEGEQYTTVAIVTGKSLNDEETVTDDDPVNFVPTSPSIDIELFVNNVDADDESVPEEVVEGEPVSLKYVVTNNGNADLGNIVVSPISVPDLPPNAFATCEKPAVLSPGDSFECVEEFEAETVGPVPATASVTADEVGGTVVVSDEDPAYYMVIDGGDGTLPPDTTTPPDFCTNVEEPKCRPLIAAGGTGQTQIGDVCSDVVVDNLEVDHNITAPDCCLVESHICNLPVKMFAVADPAECTKSHSLSIDIWDVYSFVCDYDDDEFVVAGHTTVQCDSALAESIDVQQGRRKLQDVYVYQAYFEIVLTCDVCLA